MRSREHDLLDELFNFPGNGTRHTMFDASDVLHGSVRKDERFLPTVDGVRDNAGTSRNDLDFPFTVADGFRHCNQPLSNDPIEIIYD